MAQDSSNYTMEMGTSDQVLVAAKKKKRLWYILGFGAMLIVLAVVITLVVVLPISDEADPETTTTSTSTVTPTEDPPTPPTEDPPTPPTEDPPTPPTEDPPTPPTEDPPTPPTEDPPTPDSTTEPTPTEPTPPEPGLDLDGILGDRYTPALFEATWSADGSVIMRNENGDLVALDMESNEPRLLVSNDSAILEPSPRVFLLSPNGEEVALSHNAIPLYRYSFYAQYSAVNIEEQTVTPIGPPSASVTRDNGALLQNFLWGPGTSLAFVYENNIYYQANLTDEARAVTETGESNVIYHGIPDWVYEEEVFTSNNAMWFSADGSKLAYVSFNDSDVKIMRVPHYGVPGSLDHQYTIHNEIRYPKSGTTNPTVSVTIYDVELGGSTTFDAPTDITEPIVKPLVFVNDNTVAVMWTNRVQNTLVVELCTYASSCTRIFEYSQSDGWIDNIPMIFNEAGNAFITILPAEVSGARYKQILQVSEAPSTWTITANRVNLPHTVTGILKWTSDDTIWYKATNETDSTEQHIYSANAANEVSCFTCDLRPEGECRYNDAEINDAGDMMNINCLGPNIPQVFIYNTTGDLIRVWADNAQLATELEGIEMPVTIFDKVPLPGGLPEADVQIQLPHDYETRTEPLPLLVYVYGGPDRGLATKEWVLDWGTSLVDRFDIAVARIDGRGSGLRGIDTMFAINRRLGTYEVDDQISVTRQLHERYPWLDSNRTCIWGWSYGGYASSLALSRGDGVFRCAAAVAPVVDWHFYDTIYTERFMDTPENNTEGYEQSSLLTDEAVESFRNKRYFLIHGTEDDNVHYQHAMLLSRRLQRADIFFHQMSYTDEDHGLSGVWRHLYHALEKFLRENLL